MKSSYYKTPRTQGECTFWMGGDAIERPEPQDYSAAWWTVFSVVSIVAAIVIGVTL